MMLSLSSIYTIQADKECGEAIVSIETLITKGIYRFTILGMPTKTASDTKDRVYSALRASGLLNLKSENRKIIVNLSPEYTEKKEGIYDLGIALSCISCIDNDFPEMRMLALGGLSISGHIIQSNRLKHAIYTAYTQNIPMIVCATGDMAHIEERDIRRLETYGIRIIAADTLKEAVGAIKLGQTFTIPTDKIFKKQLRSKTKIDFAHMDTLTQALFIALAGGHRIIIQTTLSFSIKQLCMDICSYVPETHFGRDTYYAHKEKLRDIDPKTSIVYLENIKEHAKTIVDSMIAPHKDSIVSLYPPCTCGFTYSFFEKNAGSPKCICSQRLILQHRRGVQITYFDLFNMHVVYVDGETKPLEKEYITKLHRGIDAIRERQFKRHAQEQKLTEREEWVFPDNAYLNTHRNKEILLQELEKGCHDLLERRHNAENTLRIARTIQDIFDACGEQEGEKNKNQSLISRKALILALSYIPRMDF